ncbi:MAG: Glutamyl-tRNA(Gln) amidotransferase subunit A [Acetothermia bacterium 64_32]|nr:MAG: Glutamyl-tRNA(Gln) amidotransferase subunit A [Acetothermia bacterium 64_32]MBC7098021.1 Asp-tRNA(Asn)/Glu-tRNA(Gln) amidotransferase subunit GatA [Candidatus Bipolaricaulota bacterium]HAF70170.1 Asp-tRNA(Asn)/Glu-tRNA(Gln) amidotransferase GatCAB subunit A [Candidatus Acetothermia bacterium]
MTLEQALADLKRGKLSLKEVISSLWAQVDTWEPRIHAFISLSDPEALIARGAGLLGRPLSGLPVAIKDNLTTVDLPTTCGSKLLEGFRPPFDATCVARLKAAGAQVQGKTNLDEFAMGSSTEHSAFGPTRNPHDPARVPGGSSGGSAAAVAAGEALVALGTDTGGSVRQPAALCGVVGLRPTYGLVSRFGLVAFASSLDTVGVLARSVRDAAFILSIISGHDPKDATSLPLPPQDYTRGLRGTLEGLRIGLPREYVQEGLSPEAKDLVERWCSLARALGAEVVELSLPLTEYALPVYYLIASAEASANLARYDGVRYGLRVPGGRAAEMMAATRTVGFGREVKRRIALGTFALSAGFYDQYYGKAQRVRTLIAREFEGAFQKVDLIMGPTSPTPAFRIGEKEDPISMYLSDVFTLPSALAGLPAISIPGGEVEGLPFGLQLIGPRLSERKLLQAALALEEAL